MSQGDPHDHVFRYSFGHTEVARTHFETHLPAAVVSEVDWSDLEQVKESFIDEALKKTESDLLYRAPLHDGGDVFLYMLLEHQRSLDYRMPLRLLQYMVRIWTRWQAERGSRFRRPQLPLIVPMVLYNGTQRWTVSTQLVELFPSGSVRDAMVPMIPDFRYDILDLSQTPDDDLRGDVLGKMTMWLLKWAGDDDFWDRLPPWLETMRTILDTPRRGIETIEALLRYIMSVAAGPPPDHIRPLLRQHLTPRAEETLMTWAEQLKQQGIEQGKQQGIEQGKQQGIEQGKQQGIEQGKQQGIEQGKQEEAAERRRASRQLMLRMLRLKFHEVDEVTVQRVQAGSIEALERWTERILVADTCEGVFAEGPAQ